MLVPFFLPPAATWFVILTATLVIGLVATVRHYHHPLALPHGPVSVDAVCCTCGEPVIGIQAIGRFRLVYYHRRGRHVRWYTSATRRDDAFRLACPHRWMIDPDF